MPVKNVYQVEGTFTYDQFCHTNESNLKECRSYERCKGHETCKTIKLTIEACTEKEAEQESIEELQQEYAHACWMVGYPTITYLHSSVDITSYWTSNPVSQQKMRMQAKGL